MNERDEIICEKRVYDCWTEAQIARNLGIDKSIVTRVIAENADYIDSLKKERKSLYKDKIANLVKLSHSAYKEILRAKVKSDVYDKDGNKVGVKNDVALMKLKKETADRVLEEIEIMKPQRKGLMIDNRKQTMINNVDDAKQREIEAQINGALDIRSLKVVGGEDG